ncbi:hypothetical protein GLOTRDRAFT_135395 [Gloeophyllum trabeum ATCC 11539]|uniref:Uncharacterized protein n=1 Tax=Gloeophyllum trabeum (strain ATCC 11539 / FP-39264 / Madison 617) TaxID=670483 RepID=S7QMI0_GLOTA|nr:uncharacterized protein GLOTRDRAFT_135395 [Gloeophyllum trabeum ATCC 11539]EPQ60771.1 hypothetical protein GLOTRDRAFT_135395 [Gloeophyllum trabeum ATCC 11539]
MKNGRRRTWNGIDGASAGCCYPASVLKSRRHSRRGCSGQRRTASSATRQHGRRPVRRPRPRLAAYFCACPSARSAPRPPAQSTVPEQLLRHQRHALPRQLHALTRQLHALPRQPLLRVHQRLPIQQQQRKVALVPLPPLPLRPFRIVVCELLAPDCPEQRQSHGQAPPHPLPLPPQPPASLPQVLARRRLPPAVPLVAERQPARLAPAFPVQRSPLSPSAPRPHNQPEQPLPALPHPPLALAIAPPPARPRRHLHARAARRARRRVLALRIPRGPSPPPPGPRPRPRARVHVLLPRAAVRRGLRAGRVRRVRGEADRRGAQVQRERRVGGGGGGWAAGVRRAFVLVVDDYACRPGAARALGGCQRFGAEFGGDLGGSGEAAVV